MGHRLEKLLEDAGIKLSAVASDILGVSGRAMLEALIAGDRDPARMADLAKRRLRSKIPELTEALAVRRRAGWLPGDQDELEAWLAGHQERVEAKGEQVVPHPVIGEFQELIDHDPVVRLYVNQMIAQVPQGKPYRKRHLQSVPQMLRLINEVLTMAPEFGEDALVMTPLGAILDWAMGTPAGFAAFRDKRINAMFGKVLTAWCEFLSSSDSRYVLNDSPSDWKCAAARRAVGIEQYQYDPGDKYWGFASWNDFFTRRFKEGARPVDSPDDDKVIVSACESTPYGLAMDVQRQDRFWIKSQPYSLQDMLANDESVDQFVGGTVYQAFLSATNYHRWHSPVAGTIVRAFVQGGTYYSEADSEGADAVEPKKSQSYLAHVAARAIILIEADDPVIGLVAFVPVGMSEVSSCVIGPDIQPGHRVVKGGELGYFQFGGSTHCLVFRPGVIADFSLAVIPQPHDPNAPWSVSAPSSPPLRQGSDQGSQRWQRSPAALPGSPRESVGHPAARRAVDRSRTRGRDPACVGD